MESYKLLRWCVVLLVTIAVGCSNGSGGSPIVPPTGPGDVPGLTGKSVVPDVGTGGHLLSGYWHILLNIEEGDLDVIPLRGTSMHLNLAGILSQNPAWLSAHVNDINIPGRLLDFDVTITHPVPNSDIRVFDVRGVLMGLGETQSALSDTSLVYTGPDGIRLLNSDGYTRWWNAVEFSTPGIFGYENCYVVPDFLVPTTTLNAYKYFADVLGPTDEVIPLVNEANRGTFSTTGTPPSMTRNYLVRFPLEDDQPKLGFHFAIDLSFAPATGSSQTPKPVSDFPLAANMPEAFNIGVNMDNSWVWYMDDENRGGDLVLDIEVFDWGAMENPDGINGEIESITLESQTLFPDPITLQSGPVVGSQTTSGVFHITIPNCTPTDVMDQEILVTVKSSYPSTYAPPASGSDWPQNAHLAAYTLVEVPILVAEPSFVSITVKSPNGGEVWGISTEQEIQWSWTDEIPMVNIDLSLDGGETYNIPIAADLENTGTFTVESVGDWASTNARIRVSSSIEPEFFDESDGNFAIESDLRVDVPNGDEILLAETAAIIKWTASETIQNIAIRLSLDSGETYMTWVVQSTPNTGMYNWEYISPDLVGDNCRIKISDVDDPTVNDESDTDFSIMPKPDDPITVLTPNGGELYEVGKAMEINWGADGAIANVSIDMSSDSGQTYTIPVTASTPNDGNFTLESIPIEAVGTMGRIRVSDVDDALVFDESDGDFTVLAESLTVVNPNGGETWQIGSSETVEWEQVGYIPTVNILFKPENDVILYDLATGIPNTNSYTFGSFEPTWIHDINLWTPIDLTLRGLVRVEASPGPSPGDDSDGFVTIHLTQGLVNEWNEASMSGDSDGDGLKDDIEQFLGTDPFDRDSEHDGMFDKVELFSNFAMNNILPDVDNDGIISPLDSDDNSDGQNDGNALDSDNDGVPNYLEFYGYEYDWNTWAFKQWDGITTDKIYGIDYFMTDPLQMSSDQDPYGDGMEISGTHMDVSVRNPGALPLVPGYPDIQVELDYYEIKLNQTVTLTDGGSIANGESWGTSTEESYSHTDETGYTIGGDMSAGFSGGSPMASMGMNFSYTDMDIDTTTNTTCESSGGSVTAETNWAVATTTSNLETAIIRLYLKVYNRGTTCASNIIPTLNLRIGGKDICTFEPGESQINTLGPGDVYPSDMGVYWVIGTLDTGAGVDNLWLTMDELRAIELGAPVEVVMTQMQADVMVLNEQGTWVEAGEWSDYQARVDSVCANIYVDPSDGNIIHYLVYADDSPTSPKVTIGDALMWVAGGYSDNGWPYISYIDQSSGFTVNRSLDDWTICIDATTYDPGETNILSTQLGPESEVILRQKAENVPVPEDLTLPQVYFAFLDYNTRKVTSCIGDYEGVQMVEFVDGYGVRTELDPSPPGSMFYYHTLPPPADYVINEQEKLVITHWPDLIFEIPLARKPVFGTVSFNGNTDRLLEAVIYEDPWNDITSVKYYASTTTPGVAMTRSLINPNIWTLQFGCTTYSLISSSYIEVKTLYTDKVTSPPFTQWDYAQPIRVSSATLNSCYHAHSPWHWHDLEAIDLQTGTIFNTSGTFPAPFPAEMDFSFQTPIYEAGGSGCGSHWANWHIHAYFPGTSLQIKYEPYGGTIPYNCIGRDDIQNWSGWWSGDGPYGVWTGQPDTSTLPMTWILQTEGYCMKISVTNYWRSYSWDYDGSGLCWNGGPKVDAYLSFDYVVFSND